MLKRCGLNSGFCWLTGSFHLQAGVLSLGLTLNFQKLSKGFVVGLGVGSTLGAGLGLGLGLMLASIYAMSVV